jgi:hypothetical protein
LLIRLLHTLTVRKLNIDIVHLSCKIHPRCFEQSISVEIVNNYISEADLPLLFGFRKCFNPTSVCNLLFEVTEMDILHLGSPRIERVVPDILIAISFCRFDPLKEAGHQLISARIQPQDSRDEGNQRRRKDDSLRQPLENGEVAVSRANHRVTYPARFMLVAAMNPCRCGHAYERGFSCKRGRVERCTADYQTRISGPLMDRIDLRIEVPAVSASDLILPPPAEGSVEVAARVAAARDIQLKRYAAAGLPHIRTNAEAPASLLETVAQPDAQGTKLLRDASETMRLSARGYHRVLRVARTLADLDGAEKIGRLHLAEALSYRALADDVRRAA